MHGSKVLWTATRIERLMAARLRAALWRMRGAQLGAKSIIGPRCMLDCPWCLSTGIRNVFEQDVYLKCVADTARIELGDFCFVGAGVEINVRQRVTIGAHSLLAPRCFIVDHTHGIDLADRIDQQPCQTAAVHVGADVWIGVNAVILPGVTIGNGAVVGANAVVREDVSAGDIVAGVPAGKIGYRSFKSQDPGR